MALPKIFQMLFGNDGKGPKLREDILPEIDVGVKTINNEEPDENGNYDIASRNVGDEWISYTGVIPEGGVPYCGQEVTREVYRDLWEYAQTQGLVKTESEWQSIASAQNGNVAFYSGGDGSTTFRMPKIVGYVKGASSQSESGSYVAEGLPNITGSVEGRPHTSGGTSYGGSLMTQSTGAFTTTLHGGTASNNGTAESTTKSVNDIVTFNASKSNSIYGNSSNVTPETSVVLFGVYAFGAIVETGELDATTLATGLARLESSLDGHIASDVTIDGDFRDLASTRGQIGDVVYGEYNCVDLNTFTKSGVYSVTVKTGTPTDYNFPSNGGMNGWLVVYANTNGRCRQVYYRLGTVGSTDKYIMTRTIDASASNYGTWRPFTSFGGVTNKGNITSGTVTNDTIVMIHSPQPQDFYINGVYWGEVNNYHGEYKTGVTLAIPAGSTWKVDHTTDVVLYVEVN